jgi:hypothetical protein
MVVARAVVSAVMVMVGGGSDVALAVGVAVAVTVERAVVVEVTVPVARAVAVARVVVRAVRGQLPPRSWWRWR